MINKFILRNNFSKYKHFIWIIFILSLLFPFNFVNKFSIYNYWDISNNIFSSYNYAYNKTFYSKMIDNDKMSDNALMNIDYISWHDGVSNIWILCFMSIGLVRILSYLNFKRKMGNNIVKNQRINKILEMCKKELGITKNIKLVMPKKYISPAIDGIFNVKIILSKEIAKFSDEKLKNIFMHELSHYKRKDNVIYWLLGILATVYWFNPILYLLMKSIKNNIEYAADEMAIKKMNEVERKEYCRTMVNVAEISCNEKIFAIGFLRKNIFNKRINCILNYRNENKNKNNQKYLLTIVICLFIIVFFTPTIYSQTMEKNIYLKTSQNENSVILLDKIINEITLTLDENEYIIIWNNENSNMCCENFKTGEKINDDYVIINLKEGDYIYKIDNKILNIKIN